MSESEQNGHVDSANGSGRAPAAVEGPPALGAWLGQIHQSDTGQDRLEWQSSYGDQPQYRLRQVLPPKVVFNPTIEEDVRNEEVPPFTLRRLRQETEFVNTRHFDACIPHEDLVRVLMQEPETLAQRTVFPGSAISAEVGVVPVGETAVTHFYVIGTVTGRRGNELSVLLPQDAINTSKRWSATPIHESLSVVISYPTPIIDVKVHSTPRGNIFGIRTQSLFTLLPFFRKDETRGVGDIRHFHWFEPIHLDKECFGGNGVTDFALDPFPARDKHARSDALIVDTAGGLWQTRPGILDVNRLLLRSPYAAVSQLRAGSSQNDGRSCFARLAFGNRPEVAVVAREDAVRVFNLEDHRLDFTIFIVPDSKTRIFDMAQPTRQYPSSPYRIICTTTEVIWLDLEKPHVPALRYKHYRDIDDTLSLHSAFCDGLCHTFLWSRKTSAITVFTHPATGPAQLVLPPYDLPPAIPNIHRWGLTTIQTSMKQRYKAVVPEALILIETAADGTVYQRELISEAAPKLYSEAIEKERVEHKRIAAETPLSNLPLEDPKPFRTAHLLMLYNRLYSNQPSLHKNYREGSRLRAKQDLAEGDIAHIPLEVVLDAGSYNDQTDRNAGSHTAYTSIESVDAASIPVESIERELDRLSLIDKAEFSFRIPKELLGHVSTDADADDPAKMSRALQDLYEIRRHGQTTASSASQVTATETAHRFACDQVAVDLALSREVMFSRAPTLIQEGSSDLAMTSYDRLADVPDIEYGYFKPVDAHGNTPSSDAARALLSEWTLGANPSVRPPFVNPYGQQIKDQKEANTQLKAFKTRIATGLGVSASQPMPGVSRPLSSRPAMAGLSEFSRLGKENDSQVLREDRTASASQNQPEMQIASSTQAETQSVPFTQMLPGVHGGRPAVKKKKKRTGGF